MFFNSRKISHGLVLLLAIALHQVSTRSVRPITFGYELGSPSGDLLPLVSDQDLDLTISAAEPRPVFVELVKRPLSLPLVAEPGAISAAASATPVLSASEKVEKVLRRPMAFSYNTDQANAESTVIVNSPKETLKTDESKLRLDQQPDAIDYYKYIARLRDDEKDGAGEEKKSSESKKEEKSSHKKENEKEEKKDKEDIREKSRPTSYLSYIPSTFRHEFGPHQPAVGFTKAIKDEPKHKSEENKEESKKESKAVKSEDHGSHVSSHDNIYESLFAPKYKLEEEHKKQKEEVGGKAEASESHAEHKEESHHSDKGEHSEQGGHSDSHQSSTDAEHKKEDVKEEAQASASDHGKGDGGGGGNFKKGGTKEYKSENIGDHGTEGDKKYSGHHAHVKSEKGHKDKLGHVDKYTENEGSKHGHHDEDGYDAENQHGEEGKRGTEFHEEGEHSKGHSTQGEHNIHKKDEYEKKHEFYDESHEGGEHEKDGGYFHEDDYHKGGHHKSEHNKGGEHEEHYGEKKKHEKGGHEHEDQGHKKASGHDEHHKHEEQEGAEGKKQGGEKWKYDKGAKEGEDSKGSHQHIQEVVKISITDGKVEASEHGKPAEKVEDSKGADYHVREITDEKQLDEYEKSLNIGNQPQASEEYGGHHEPHEEQRHAAYNHDGEHEGHHGHEANEERESDRDHYSLLEEGQGHNAQLQNEDSNEEKQHHHFGDSYGHFHGADTRPQKAEQHPNQEQTDRFSGDPYLRLLHNNARSEDLQIRQNSKLLQPHAEGLEAYGSNIHLKGQAAPEQARPESEAQAQGEESAPNRHILVLGNDGKIYSVLSNEESIGNAGLS